MTYYAGYAPNNSPPCQWLDCVDKQIADQELRLGIGKSRTAWYHVDCFFKFLLEAGPKKLKLLEVEQLIGVEELTEEDKLRVDEKIRHCHQEKANRKRKAEEDINERYTKIAKTDLPWLSNDNLHEILIGLHSPTLLSAARVCKQFYAVARKLLFDRVITTREHLLLNATAVQMRFVSQIRHLNLLAYESCLSAYLLLAPASDKRDQELEALQYNPNGKAIAELLTNLDSLSVVNPHETTFPFSDLVQLTKLKKLSIVDLCFTFRQPPLTWVTALDPLTNLRNLSIGIKQFQANVEDLQILETRLTSLCLENMEGFDAIDRFTNLEHLDLHNQKVPSEDPLPYLHFSRLTSLRFNTNHPDMALYTTLKTLDILDETDILALPPNLEHLTCCSMWSNAKLPSTLKSFTVDNALIPATLDSVKADGTKFNVLTALSSLPNCNITLICYKCPSMPQELIELPNLTIRIDCVQYGKTLYNDVVQFIQRPLPKRVWFRFYNWKNCKYKQKLLGLLETVKMTTALLIDTLE